MHFVVSELSLRGLIALPTIRNKAGVDLVVTKKAGSWQANLQVKTSRSRVGSRQIGKKYGVWVGSSSYYVFVRCDPSKKGLEAFLAVSDYVARMVTESLEVDKQRGLKEWVACFYPREDIEKLRVQWDAFGREFVWQTLRSPDPASTPNLL